MNSTMPMTLTVLTFNVVFSRPYLCYNVASVCLSVVCDVMYCG